jgi:phage-related protein
MASPVSSSLSMRVLLHSYIKKSQKAPASDLETATKRLKAYERANQP